MKIELEIRERRIADLMVAAIEGNPFTKDWCTGVRLVRGKKRKSRIWYDDERLYAFPFEIEIDETNTETSEVRTHKIGEGELMAGLVLMAENYGNHFGDFMADNEDAITANIFLQCVALGEVRYS